MQSITRLTSIDYLVIGHISQDLTPEGPKMGGTASYAALTAKILGLRVGIVTSWGKEIPADNMEDITIINHPAENSTTFENIYTETGRLQVIHSIAHKIEHQHIPANWVHSPIVHLGPIAQEVDPEITKYFRHSLIGVTPQGWLRSWDDQGHVHPIEWQGASQVLGSVDATIISVEDVGGDEDIIAEMAAASPVFVVTEGYYGARVYWHGDVRRFNAPQVKEVNATGAGDIFAAAFFTQLQKTRDPWEAARFANQLAAQSVTRSGLASIPTGEEVKNAIIEVL